MKTALPILSDTVVATAAIPQKHFVGFDGAKCAAGAKATGVAYFDAEAGDALTVDVLGFVLVITGAAVAIGDAVESDADGAAITHTTGAVNGYARTAATGAGQVIRILAA